MPVGHVHGNADGVVAPHHGSHVVRSVRSGQCQTVFACRFAHGGPPFFKDNDRRVRWSRPLAEYRSKDRCEADKQSAAKVAFRYRVHDDPVGAEHQHNGLHFECKQRLKCHGAVRRLQAVAASFGIWQRRRASHHRRAPALHQAVAVVLGDWHLACLKFDRHGGKRGGSLNTNAIN